MGKDKKSKWSIIREGTSTIKLLDNTNIYGVIFSECISNIFKEGMWQRVLNPYILFLAHHNKGVVGNAITLNSTIRAVCGVVAGRFLINSLGCDATFCITGIIGVIGIGVNVYCLLNGSLWAAFMLNAVWGVYTGLWNSCLEVEWARSIVREHREDVSNMRQITNKLTTAFGPLLSLGVFYYFGNTWSMDLIVFVMLLGTGFTILPVILCFRFDRIHEVRQEARLCDIEKIQFSAAEIEPSKLKKVSFAPMEGGPIRLSYPLKDTSKYCKLRVFTPDLRETDFILGKQYRAWFRNLDGTDIDFESTGVVYFQDPSRPPVRASLESYSVFLKKDGHVNLHFSQIVFNLSPDLSRRCSGAARESAPVRGLSKLFFKSSVSEFDSRQALHESLLGMDSMVSSTSASADDDKKLKKMKKGKGKVYEPNIVKANVIVGCDVLNAIASGMSLKFMDLFLIEEYDLSPAGVLGVQILQSMATAYLTPFAKQTMNSMGDYGFKRNMGVVLIWSCSCCFMAVLCIPKMPLWVVIGSIVLMASLISCTKAYNRARLINALPHDRVANYMVWDSLNKANQGGITILGAQVVQWGGYRACFISTLIIFIIRLSIYFGYSLHKGIRKKEKTKPPVATDDLEREQVNTSKTSRRTQNRASFGDTVHVSIVEDEDAHQDEASWRNRTHTDSFHNDDDPDDPHVDDSADEGAVGWHGEADSELFGPEPPGTPANNLLVVDDDGPRRSDVPTLAQVPTLPQVQADLYKGAE